MLDMIIASFLQIWHIIPIIIGIILFRKFLNNKDRKQRIQKHEEHEKNGLSLELRTGKKYEDLGYSVVYGDESKKEQGVDLLCSKGDKTLVIKCKDDTNPKSITSEDITTFIKNASKYVQSSIIDDDDVEFRYAVLYPQVFDKTAIKILKDDSYNCKYIVL